MLRQEAALREDKADLREDKMRVDVLAREELNVAKEKEQAEREANNKQFKKRHPMSSSNRNWRWNEAADSSNGINGKTGARVSTRKVVRKRHNCKKVEARLQLERQLTEEKCKTLRLEYEAKFRRHELAESWRLAPIPQRESSSGLEQTGSTHTGVHQQYAYSVPTLSLAQTH